MRRVKGGRGGEGEGQSCGVEALHCKVEEMFHCDAAEPVAKKAKTVGEPRTWPPKIHGGSLVRQPKRQRPRSLRCLVLAARVTCVQILGSRSYDTCFL